MNKKEKQVKISVYKTEGTTFLLIIWKKTLHRLHV